MSAVIMAACWPLQMPPPAKGVLMALADLANDQGCCWPEISTICERTCRSQAVVTDAIAWLESCGVMTTDRSGRHVITAAGFKGGKGRYPNRKGVS